MGMLLHATIKSLEGGASMGVGAEIDKDRRRRKAQQQRAAKYRKTYMRKHRKT